MNIPEKILKNDEKSIFKLRELYESYGYKKYKMKKFEEYELYAQNKNFLLSDNIITFNDNSGRLMALKPDVTLSIVKNAKAKKDEITKAYYNENVYRMKDGEFKELSQLGVEYIGEIDLYSLYETVILAKNSLDIISKDNVLDISHMGIILGIIDSYTINYSVKENLLKCLKTKNEYDIINICCTNNLPASLMEKLTSLIKLYGKSEEVLPKVRELARGTMAEESVNELEELYGLLKATNKENKIRLDFSVINDLGYYNGIVFQGFIKDIPFAILSGGRYDKLVSKFDILGGAIGFAIYMDLIELYGKSDNEYDVDVLIIYKNADVAAVINEVTEKRKDGKTVKAVIKGFEKNIHAKETILFD